MGRTQKAAGNLLGLKSVSRKFGFSFIRIEMTRSFDAYGKGPTIKYVRTEVGRGVQKSANFADKQY